MDQLADLIATLRPAPAGWTEAAQALPVARAQIDSIVARAEADAAYREQVIADLEQALTDAGQEPTPRAVDALRRSLDLG